MLWIFGFIAILPAAAFLLAMLCLRAAFGGRCEGDPALRYFTHEDFGDMDARPVAIPSDRGQLLRGAVYTCPAAEPAGLVIFAHGMGGGHLSYMTELHTLARAGFAALAYDNTGTMSSEGKSLGSFYQAARDLRAALAFARGEGKWPPDKIVLAGHSWGGYAVCQTLAREEENVAGAVAFSPPDSPAAAICDSMRELLGVPMGWLRPALAAASIAAGGWDARHGSAAALARTERVPVLLLHGDADTSVRLQNSPLSRAAVREKDNITAVLYPGRGHNVYQTAESERYLREVMGAIGAAKRKYGKAGVPPEEQARLYAIDYELITREDPAVMGTAMDFMRACVEGGRETRKGGR